MLFTNRPALKFALPLILGIILGWKYTFSIGYLLVIAAAVFILIFVVNLIKREKKSNVILTCILIGLFGMIKITYDSKYISDENISNYVGSDQSIFLDCTVVDLPRISSQSVKFVVEAESVRVGTRKYKAEGGVLVSLLKTSIDSTMIDSIVYGRKLNIKGELSTINTSRNPGEFDLRNYLNLNNIYARMFPEKFDSSCLGQINKHNFMALLVYPVRQSVVDKIDKFIGGEEGKFLKGLVIGERSEIPLEVKTAFINSGVMHILAVSGLHVAIVALIIVVALQFLRIPEKPRIILTCLLLVYYNFLTGSAPSVARSVIMAIVFLSARLFERRSDMYNTLAISAIILLLIDSKQLFQPGFQLSFAAVFSIIYLYPKIYKLKNYLPERLRENKMVIILIASIAVSVAAGIGTLPFTSIYFGKISIVSFAANLVIVPLSNVILALGMLTVAVSYLSTWLASIYADLTSILTWVLLKLVDYLGIFLSRI